MPRPIVLPRVLLPTLFPTLLLPVLLLALTGPLAAQEQRWTWWEDTDPTVDLIESEITAAKSALDAIASDAAEGSPAANLRNALARRVQLLEEWAAVLRTRAEVESLRANIDATPTVRAEIDALRNSPDPTPPVSPTDAELAALKQAESDARLELETFRKRLEAAKRRTDSLSAENRKFDERIHGARERRTGFENALPSAAPGEATDLLRLQLANTHLNERVATAAKDQLRVAIDTDTALGPYRNAKVELAQARIDRRTEEIDLHARALDRALQSEQDRLRSELAALRDEAQNAADPLDRFLAGWRAEIKFSEQKLLESGPIERDTELEKKSQELRLEANRIELVNLRSDVDRYGTSGAVGRRIQQIFRVLPQRRRSVELSVKPRFEEKYTDFVDRRFEVDLLLNEVDKDRFRELIAEATPQLSEDERRRFFKERADPVRQELTDALQKERLGLTRTIAAIDGLTQLRRDRLSQLAELETFVHTEVFLIQDLPPFGRRTIDALPEELSTIRAKSLALVSKDSLAELRHELGTLERMIWGIVLLLGLPALTLWIRRRIRRVLRREGIEEGRSAAGRAGLLVAALVQVALFPAALVALSVFVGHLATTSGAAAVASRTIAALAVFFALRGIAKTFFSKTAITVRLGLLPEATASELRRSLRAISLSVVALGLPWSLLSLAPYSLEWIPRSILIAFSVTVGIAIWRAFHGNARVFRDWIGESPSKAAQRVVQAWSLLLGASLIAIPLLQLSGRGYASSSVSLAILLSLATWIALPVVYAVLVPILGRWAASPPPPEERSPEDESGVRTAPEQDHDPEARRQKVVAGLRIALGAIGALAFIEIWGVNERVWNAMKGWEIYSGGVDPEGAVLWVTAGDVLYAIIAMTLTMWLLRHLPGIYDMTIFPRFQVDKGLRYAIITISRYGLFFVGALIAFRALRFDLTQLGWLVAAMGIGLGFGLQEIVSNFVSGLILLVERPIRPGDLITVGGVVGRVQRINIRATTVLNADRQEVIVPNRSLIANEVMNWTLKDQVTRLKIPMGVAYGSDVAAVRQALLEVGAADPETLQDPAPQVYFLSHGASSLDFELWVYVSGPQVKFPTLDRINEAMNRKLDEMGVEIPFPQQDVHLRTDVVLANRDGKGSAVNGAAHGSPEPETSTTSN